MNGTNAVGMNGTNAVGMNGTNAVGLNGGFYSTADVVPGLNGLTSGITLNGCNCAELSAYDVEPMAMALNGTQEERDAFILGMLYGDNAAIQAAESGNLNGWLDVLKARKRERQTGRTAERDARRARRAERFASRQARLAEGGGFFQNLGEGIKAIAPGLAEKLGGQTDESLQDLGVDANLDVLADRTFDQLKSGVGPDTPTNAGGNWWTKSTPVTKAAIIGGGLLVAYFAAKQFGIIGKKKKRK